MGLYHNIENRTWMVSPSPPPCTYMRWRVGSSKGSHDGLGCFQELVAFSGLSMMLSGNTPPHLIEMWLSGLTV